MPLRIRPLFGGRFGPPFKTAGYLGIVATRQSGPHGDYDGATIGIEAGAGGAQLSFGRAAGSFFGSVRYHASVLHTWGNSDQVEPGQNFLGVEFRLMVVAVGVGVGAYGRVTGDAPGDSGLFTVNGFVGF